MKVLITGGAGFIGSHLADQLLGRGDEVTVLDDLSTGRLENVARLQNREDFTLEVDSVLNQDVVDRLMEGQDLVVHLAAAVGVQYIIDNPLKSIEINVRGTEHVLEAANGEKIPVFLASTSEIYGKNQDVPFAEDHDRILGPNTITRWSYSCTKAVDEFLGLAYWRKKQLPVVVGRFFNTVGPRQSGRYGMVIPRFVKQALLGHPLTVYGDGQQTRTFLDVQDAVTAVLGLLERKDARGEIFNIGSEERVTIEELARRIVEKVGSSSELKYIPYEEAYEKGFEDMRHRVPDVSKLREWIDFEQQYFLDDILDRTIDYFRDNDLPT